MKIVVRNRELDESPEEYQAYLDGLFAPIAEMIVRIRQAASEATE